MNVGRTSWIFPRKPGETVHVRNSTSGPSNQELCNRLRQLEIAHPSLQTILTSQFHSSNKTYDQREVNRENYVTAPGDRIELAVRLAETSKDDHIRNEVRLRCLPSREKDKCFWALIREDGSFDFVKYHKQQPTGYRKFNERDGNFGHVIAKAIRGPRKPKAVVESIEISSGKHSFALQYLC